MRLVALATLTAVALSIAYAEPALACGPGRPACTVLRPAPELERPRPSRGYGQQCIVTVGGLASPTDGSDNDFFIRVLGELTRSLDHRVFRFGVDRGSYDTQGAVSRSSAGLRRMVRSIAGDCEGIHLLAHSMGGLVTDRALAKVDPAALGVATYVAMSSPHNGATAARILTAAAGLAPALADLADAIDAPDLRSDAVRDLAAARRPTRLPRVDEQVRVRMTTDEIVLRADHFDPRVDVREFAPDPLSPEEWLGHGGVVHSAAVQDLVRTTITTGRVPPRAP